MNWMKYNLAGIGYVWESHEMTQLEIIIQMYTLNIVVEMTTVYLWIAELKCRGKEMTSVGGDR